MKKTLAFMLLLSFSCVASDDIHQFSSGEILKASDLNLNFAQLNTSINENTQKIASLSEGDSNSGLILDTNKNDVIEGEVCTSLTNLTGITYTINREVIQTSSQAFELLFPDSNDESSDSVTVQVTGLIKNNPFSDSFADTFNGYAAEINSQSFISRYDKSKMGRSLTINTKIEDKIQVYFGVNYSQTSSSGISNASDLVDDASNYYSAVSSCLYIGKL